MAEFVAPCNGMAPTVGDGLEGRGSAFQGCGGSRPSCYNFLEALD